MNFVFKNRILTVVFLMGVLIILSFSNALAGDMVVDRVIELVNYERTRNGLPIVLKNHLLEKASQKKLEDMVALNYFSHTSPDGVTPWHWFESEGYDYAYAGENLAIDFDSADDQHQAWMGSLTHKKNILNNKYQEIGVAVGRGMIDGKDRVIAVQFFGARRNAENEYFANSYVSSVLDSKNSLLKESFQTYADKRGQEKFFQHFNEDKFKSYSFYSALIYELRREYFHERNKEMTVWLFSIAVVFIVTMFNLVVFVRRNYYNSSIVINSVLWTFSFGALLFFSL